jgi:hypothetical protein
MGRIQTTRTRRLHQKHETTHTHKRKKNLQPRKIQTKNEVHRHRTWTLKYRTVEEAGKARRQKPAPRHKQNQHTRMETQTQHQTNHKKATKHAITTHPSQEEEKNKPHNLTIVICVFA